MTSRNLRHLRVFIAVTETASVTQAAARCSVSQPAVTQALAKLEVAAGGALFDRARQSFVLTDRGRMLAGRVKRALALIDGACADIELRLGRVVTTSQLRALIAVNEAENLTLAARALGLTPPSIHRAIMQLENLAGAPMFERTPYRIIATRPCQDLAQAARLALAELDQADAELAELDGREVGRIVIGALPLSRTALLPRAIVSFRRHRPRLMLKVINGSYTELLTALRRGDVDLILGTIREPAPIGDIVQEPLFSDRLAVLAGLHHPLAARANVTPAELANFGWILPRLGSPTRDHFDAFAATWPTGSPASVIECGSILFIREFLSLSDHLACISSGQAEAEVSKGLLVRLNPGADWPTRRLGMAFRSDWAPTTAQSLLLDCLRSAAADICPR